MSRVDLSDDDVPSYLNTVSIRKCDSSRHKPLETYSPEETIPFTDDAVSKLRFEFYGEHPEEFENKLRSRVIQLEEPLRSAVRRLYIAIDAYAESSHPIFTKSQLLEGSLSKDFCTYLKRYRAKVLCNQFDLVFLDEPDWFNEIIIPPTQWVEDIGDVFNYRYCLPWEEVCDDYLCGLLPLTQEEEMLTKFREKLRLLLNECPSNPKIVLEEEILLDLSSSSSVDSAQKKLRPHWRVKEDPKKNFFASNGISGIRTVIQAVGGCRDTVILDPSSLNSIKIIDQQTFNILQFFGENGMVRDSNQLFMKLEKIFNKHTYFLCRDIKKEGITKPRNLLAIMLEELELRYPWLPAWKYKEIYKSYNLTVDNEEVKMVRGHGLGMANSLTTLLQIVIFHMVLEHMEENSIIVEEDGITAIAFNDDYAAAFKSETDLENYWDSEDEVMRGLGVLRQASKSFKTSGNKKFLVLCEVYFPYHMSFKESYMRREVLNCLSCVNITQAKQVFNNLHKGVNPNVILSYMNEIVSFYGHEFHPNEIDYPFILGGWISNNYKSASMDLFNIDLFDEPMNLNGAYEASKHRLEIYLKSSKGVYQPPIKTLFGIADIEGPEVLKAALNFGTLESLSKRFYRSSQNPQALTAAWERLKRKRIKTYEETKIMSFELIKEKIRVDNPGTDFIEKSQTLITLETYENKYKGNPVFSTSNPLFSAIAWYNPLRDIVRPVLVPNPLPFLLEVGDHYKVSTAQWRKDRRNLMTSRELPLIPLGEERIFKYERLEEEIFQAYIDPQNASFLLKSWGFFFIPLITPCEEKREWIRIRDSVAKIRSEDLVVYSSTTLNADEYTFLRRVEGCIPEDLLLLEAELEVIEPEEPEPIIVELETSYWGWLNTREDGYPIYDSIEGKINQILGSISFEGTFGGEESYRTWNGLSPPEAAQWLMEGNKLVVYDNQLLPKEIFNVVDGKLVQNMENAEEGLDVNWFDE
jgi:hypothetical protein